MAIFTSPFTLMAAQLSISQPPLSLAGRVAIVTGSSRGIGKAIAIYLATLGARIVVNYTSKAADAERVAAEINDFPANEEITGKGPRAIAVQADVSEPSQVKSLFDAAESAFESPVHILVNSAGILDPKYPTVADTLVEDYDRIFSVNTKGAFLCSKEAANRLKQGGGGRIILLTSSITRSLKPGYAVYAASKAAVETMVKILAKELKGTGITANCVAPGPIATEMFFDGKSPELVQKIAAESPFGDSVKPKTWYLLLDSWLVMVVNGSMVKMVDTHKRLDLERSFLLFF